jgi:hypothetical protein
MLLPVFDKRSLFDILTSKESPSHSLTAGWSDGDWFYDIPAKGYGSMPKIEINYTRFWSDMRNHVKWSLSYQSGNAWIDVSNQMTIRTVNRNGGNEKFAIDFTPQQSGQHKLQLTIDWNALNWNYDNTNSEYKLSYKTGNYNWGFNYSFKDIRSVTGLGFTHSVNPQGQLVFNITKNILAGAIGRKISLDPTYGLISDSTVSTWEYDQQEGDTPNMIRLGTSEYYLIASQGDTGAENDGYLRTIRVWSNNGTIQQSLVDSLEYDTSDGYYPVLCHISGDVYMVVYDDLGGGACTAKTFYAWSSNGSISDTLIDTLILSATATAPYDIEKMYSNIYVVTYLYSLVTIWVNNTGTINNTVLDTVAFDIDAATPHTCVIDSNTIALVYDANMEGDSDGYMSTWNISATGDITNTRAAFWEFDTVIGNHPTIEKVTGNIFMVAYQQTGGDLYIKTCQINNSGGIWNTWIDTQIIDANNGDFITFFNITYNSTSKTWIKGISFSGTDFDGYISTFDVDYTGMIGSEIDTLEITPADTVAWYSPTTWVNQSYYLLVTQDVSLDGWAKTFTIETNWANPIFSDPDPANNSIGISGQPTCSITINDTNGDLMDLYWCENSTGTWIIRQVDSDKANGTYTWSFSQASSQFTKYYWKACANDSLHNVSKWYCFTTTGNNQPTIELSYPVPNGITNVPANPICGAWTNDTDLDTLTITWQENSTGSWVTRQVNTSIASGTNVTWNSTGIFGGGGKTYYFKVYADDGTINISNTFHFKTIDINPPIVSNPYPANHSTGIPVTPQMHVQVNDPDGNLMNIIWYSNSSTPDSLILRPEANGSSTQLTRSAENSNYKCVDETTANDDTDYVYANKKTSYNNDTYVMQNSSKTNIIESINIYARMRKYLSGFGIEPSVTCKGKITLLIDGIYYDGSENTLTTSYVNYNYSWSTNPDTGLAWTWDDINNMQVGIALKGYELTTTHSRCTQLYIEVTYINHSNWAVFGTNNSVYNGTYYQTNANFSELDTTYYWRVNVTDGANWINRSYDFTTGISNNPPVLSNPDPANNSIDIPITQGTLTVTIEDPDGDTFNYYWSCSDGSSNSAVGNTNGSKIFMLNPGDLDYGTLYTWWVNVTDGEDWTNITYFFTTESGIQKKWNTINTWNGSLYFSGAYNLESEINGSLYVVPSYNLESEINGSLYFQGSYNLESEINGSLYVSTVWNTANDWNGSLYVSPSLWKTSNIWNGSLYYVSEEANITLSNPSPVNLTIVIHNISISIQRNHSSGYLMNTSFWFNGTYLFTNYSFGNGTLTFNLSDYWVGTLLWWHTYVWTVNCSNGTEYANKTYSFIPVIPPLLVQGYNRNMILLVAIQSSAVFSLLILCMRKKKKNQRI